MTGRCIVIVALLGVMTLLAGLGGCAPLAQLPDFTRLPDRVLSKDEQQGKVKEMIERGQTHQTEAAREIEQGR